MMSVTPALPPNIDITVHYNEGDIYTGYRSAIYLERRFVPSVF